MLELSRFSQAILVDGLIRRKKGFSKLMGPWVTVYFHQSRGWPFVLSAWGFWDLMFLEGNSRFKQHWFYFTGLQIFSKQNSGAYILSSQYYLRILFCMIIAGIARSLKETVLTLYFGRRMVGKWRQTDSKNRKELTNWWYPHIDFSPKKLHTNENCRT